MSDDTSRSCAQHTLRTLIVLAAALAAVLAVQAAVPPDVVHYQGVLRDATDVPLTGEFDMVFRFFESEMVGNEILVDEHRASGTGAVTVTGGLFGVDLGGGAVHDGAATFPGDPYLSLAKVFADFDAVWLQIEIDFRGSLEVLSPRVRVLASAYALNSAHLGGRDASGYVDTSIAAQTKAGDLGVDGALEVGGQLTVRGGTPAQGKVLTSDASGVARWEEPSLTGPLSGLDELADRLGTEDPSDLPYANLYPYDCAGGSTTTLTLNVNGSPAGTVVGFVGQEAISTPYELMVAVETTGILSSALDSDAQLVLDRNGEVTTFSGIVTEFGLAGITGAVRTYVYRIEPRLVRGDRSTRYRSWANQRPTDVIHTLAIEVGYSGGGGSSPYPLDWEIQYNETNLDFLQRLADRDGIHYHFPESGTSEGFQFGLTNADFTDIARTYPYYGDQASPGPGVEFVATFHSRDRLATATLTVGGYDDDATGLFAESATLAGALSGSEITDFQGGLLEGPDVAMARADAAAGRENVRRSEHTGTGNAAGLKAGHRFTLDDQSAAGFGGDYVVTSVRHYATTGDGCVSYGNAFAAVPDSVVYSPPIRTARPVIEGVMTGVVTANFQVDKPGQVQVRLHENLLEEASEGWIRVATPPGKNGKIGDDSFNPGKAGWYGGSFLPEVDTEVLVAFIEGDPRAPIVVGSLYNGTDRPPTTDELWVESLTLGNIPDVASDLHVSFWPAGAADPEQLTWNVAGSRFDLTDDLRIEGLVDVMGDIDGGGDLTVPGAVEAGGLIKGSGGLDLLGGIDAIGNLDVTGSIDGLNLTVATSINGSVLNVTSATATTVNVGGVVLSNDGGLLDVSSGIELDTGDLAFGTGEILGNPIVLRSDGFARTVIDADNNSTTSIADWFHHESFIRANKLAEIQEDGDMRIRGTLSENTTFDLAESFYARKPVEPGDVVSLDPQRAGAVVLSGEERDPRVLGVVSARPGVLLGSAPFDEGGLRASWGDDIAALYAGERERMRDLVLGEHPDLLATLDAGDAGAEDRVESLCLEAFHAAHFAPVALAGRVPVKVDASFGAVVAGDALTPSPIPGVAMRADGPGPVIGTALEGLASGRGKVVAFIHRSYYAPVDSAGVRQAGDLPATADGTAEAATRVGTGLATGGQDANEVSAATPLGPSDIDSDVFHVDPQGNVYARGAFYPASKDLAEFFPLSGAAGVGDLLVVDRDEPGRFRPATEAHDPAVIGIVSEEPGVLLGSGIDRITEADRALADELAEARRTGDREREEEIWTELRARFRETHAPVALSGTVPCKVDAGFGAIRPGDLLTTSPTPGHAMRAADAVPGTIVAKALEALETGTGVIRVLVWPR